MEKLKMHTPDLTEANIDRIRELFPNCVTEAQGENGNLKLAVDFDQLRQELSDSIVEGPQERYHLNWPGKREALLTANAPIAKTLRPAPEESVDFENTKNLFIEGDNLEALKLLQETYLGKVNIIYIDPPYNTGNDFIYEDDFAEDAEEFFKKSNQKDESGNRLVSNPEANGRFHSDWLSMMYPRIRIARALLKDDGVIFISIDDNELFNLVKLCNELFGEENFVNLINIKAKDSSGASGGGEDKRLKKNIEYLLCYSKSSSFRSFNSIYKVEYLSNYIKQRKDQGKGFAYTQVLVDEGQETFLKNIKDGSGEIIEVYTVSNYIMKTVSQISKEEQIDSSTVYDKYFDKIFTTENAQTSIRGRVLEATPDHEGLVNIYYKPVSGRNKGKRTKVSFDGKTKRLVSYLNGVAERSESGIIKKDKIGTLWDDLSWSSVALEGGVSYPNGKKPIKLIQRFLQLYQLENNEKIVVMDFFAGSGTVAHACMDFAANNSLDVQSISVQLPEEIKEKDLKNYYSDTSFSGIKTVCDVAKERIRRAGKKILEGQNHEGWNKDVGFRVLKVDTSNMADIYYSPDATKQADLLAAVANIKPDRKPEDLLFQVLLDWGVDLSLPITKQTIQGKTVFFVDSNALVACFDGGITEELVKEIAKTQPLRAVFKDNGFVSDSVKINAEQIFKQISPSTDIKAI